MNTTVKRVINLVIAISFVSVASTSSAHAKPSVLEAQRDLLRKAHVALSEKHGQDKTAVHAALVTAVMNGESDIAEPIDWVVLRESSLRMSFSETNRGALTRFCNLMRDPANPVHESDVEKVVKVSTFIDYLLSELADECLPRPFYANLQPSSLWRAYLILAPVTTGDVKFQNSGGKFTIEFGPDANDQQKRFQTQYAAVANFECISKFYHPLGTLDCLSSNWLDIVCNDPFEQKLWDYEEKLHPNEKSDIMRRSEIYGAVQDHYDWGG